MDTTHSINSPGRGAHEAAHTHTHLPHLFSLSYQVSVKTTQTVIHISSIMLRPANVSIQHTYITRAVTHFQTHTVTLQRGTSPHTRLSFCAAVPVMIPDLVDVTNFIIVAVQAIVPISILHRRLTNTHIGRNTRTHAG